MMIAIPFCSKQRSCHQSTREAQERQVICSSSHRTENVHKILMESSYQADWWNKNAYNTIVLF